MAWLSRGATVLLFTVTLGCSMSGYVADRGRNAADVLTATLGFGLGAKLRVGPVQSGLLFSVDYLGLRCGHLSGNFLDDSATAYSASYFPYDLCFLATGLEWSTGGDTPYLREKVYVASQEFVLVLPKVGEAQAEIVDPERQFASSGTRHFPRAFFSDIHVVVALGVSVRLGLNPGEAADFLLGWAGVDVMDDDLLRKRDRGTVSSGLKVVFSLKGYDDDVAGQLEIKNTTRFPVHVDPASVRFFANGLERPHELPPTWARRPVPPYQSGGAKGMHWPNFRERLLRLGDGKFDLHWECAGIRSNTVTMLVTGGDVSVLSTAQSTRFDNYVRSLLEVRKRKDLSR